MYEFCSYKLYGSHKGSIVDHLSLNFRSHRKISEAEVVS